MNMKCPKCGKSHYRELGCTTTCMMWHPEYKDGKLVNSNPNVTTESFKCCECGAHFHTVIGGEPVLDDKTESAKPDTTAVLASGVKPTNGSKKIAGFNIKLGNRVRASVKCRICDEATEVYGDINASEYNFFICDKCKKAILKMRENMEKEQECSK